MEPDSHQSRQMLVELYNVHLFPPLVARIEACVSSAYIPDGKLRLETLIDALRETSADVIFLCEMWYTPYANHLIKSLHKIWPHSLYPQPFWGNFSWLGSGLLLLSKIPITGYQFEPFNQSGGFDSCAEKGMLFVNFENGMKILGAHLQAPYSRNHYLNVRNAQIDQLAAVVKRIPVHLVLGDFNLNYKGKKFAKLSGILQEQCGLMCCSRLDINGDFETEHRKSVERRRTFIFASSPICVGTDPIRQPELFKHSYCYRNPKHDLLCDLSDHLPYLTRIEF